MFSYVFGVCRFVCIRSFEVLCLFSSVLCLNLLNVLQLFVFCLCAVVSSCFYSVFSTCFLIYVRMFSSMFCLCVLCVLPSCFCVFFVNVCLFGCFRLCDVLVFA